MALIHLGVPTKKSPPRRVLLLTAPRPRPNYTPLHFGDNRAPQGLGYVAAYLRKFGHEVKIIDLYAFSWRFKELETKVESPWRKHKDALTGRNWARTMDGDLKTIEGHSRGGFAQNNSDGTMEVGTDLQAEIGAFKPDFVGMYIHSMSFDAGVALARRLKQDYPDIPLMCGGPHPSVLPETIPDTFDHVVIGEGETAVLDIVEGRAPGRMVQGQRVVEMDELPWPDLDDFWDLPYNWALKLFGKEEIHPTISLNTSRGCPFLCVAGDTMVFTDKGFERIDDLFEISKGEIRAVNESWPYVERIHRRVATHDGGGDAVAIIDQGAKPTLELMTENGLVVKATKDHKFMTLADYEPVWRPLGEMKSGDWLILKEPEREWPTDYVELPKPKLPDYCSRHLVRKSEQTPSLLTEDVAWLIGCIIGDGCIPADARPAISVAVKPRTEKQLRRIVPECFGVKLATNPACNTDKIENGQIHSRAAYEFFVQCLGLTPKNKHHVPEAVRRSPKSIVRAFIQGLYDTDGYESKADGGKYIATSYRSLAMELAYLYIMIGEVPGVAHVHREADEFHAEPYVTYRVTTYRQDRIPSASALYKSHKSGKWYWRTAKNPDKHLGVRRSTLNESGLAYHLNKPGWHYVRVKSIVDAMPQRVYDISVPGHGSFLANGLVAKNCDFCGVQEVSGARYRHISAKRIMEHIGYLKDKYGIRGVYFREDNFSVNMKRVDEICEMLISEGMDIKWACESRVNKLTPERIARMAKSGCVGLYIGVESGSDRMLTYMRKGETRADFEEKFPILHDHGIGTYTTFIYGMPTETPADRRATDSLIDKIKPKTVDAFIYLGIPKSNWYDMIDKNGEYELKDESAFIYPNGYLGYIRELYGRSDPRVEYVERVYEENKVTPVFYDW